MPASSICTYTNRVLEKTGERNNNFEEYDEYFVPSVKKTKYNN